MTPPNPVPRILIVDGDAANIAAMRRFLEDVDADIVEASNGNDALALSLEHEFALIILDVQMPVMNGYETAELMRGAERTRHTSIVLMTANMLDEISILKGYDVGAVDYIAKPINKRILLGKVNLLLDLYNQNRELRELRITTERATQMKSDFLSCMGHEIRTPLNAIIGMT